MYPYNTCSSIFLLLKGCWTHSSLTLDPFGQQVVAVHDTRNERRILHNANPNGFKINSLNTAYGLFFWKVMKTERNSS